MSTIPKTHSRSKSASHASISRHQPTPTASATSPAPPASTLASPSALLATSARLGKMPTAIYVNKKTLSINNKNQ